MRLYLCNIFARWVYKDTNARSYTMMRCFLSERCVCIFVKYLQDRFIKLQTHAVTRWCVAFCRNDALCKLFARWVYKTTNARNERTRALNPRFCLVHASTKPRFLTKMMHQKSGIPCSGNDDALPFFVGLMRLYLCNIFARWVYKIQTHAMTRRCVAFFCRIDAFVSL